MANGNDEKMETYNHDVSGICSRLTRFSVELYKSVSSGGAFTNEFDQQRWSDYLDAADRYIDHIVGQPQIDAPESHPRKITLDCLPDVEILAVENESIRDCLYYLKLATFETANSQSSRMAAGLLPFDESRCRAMIEKSRRLLVDYVTVIQPLDLPESTPSRTMSGSGKTGI